MAWPTAEVSPGRPLQRQTAIGQLPLLSQRRPKTCLGGVHPCTPVCVAVPSWRHHGWTGACGAIVNTKHQGHRGPVGQGTNIHQQQPRSGAPIASRGDFGASARVACEGKTQRATGSSPFLVKLCILCQACFAPQRGCLLLLLLKLWRRPEVLHGHSCPTAHSSIRSLGHHGREGTVMWRARGSNSGTRICHPHSCACGHRQQAAGCSSICGICGIWHGFIWLLPGWRGCRGRLCARMCLVVPAAVCHAHRVRHGWAAVALSLLCGLQHDCACCMARRYCHSRARWCRQHCQRAAGLWGWAALAATTSSCCACQRRSSAVGSARIVSRHMCGLAWARCFAIHAAGMGPVCRMCC